MASLNEIRVTILADVPLWTLPGMEHLYRPGHYATWIESLIPAFAASRELDIHWICMSQQADKPLTHEAHNQTFHILPRSKKSFSMVTAYLSETRRITTLINHIRPTLIHAWGSEDVYGLAAARSKFEKRLFTLQGCLSDYLKLLGGGFLFRLQTLYEKHTIRRFQMGTAESPSAADALKCIHPTMEIQLVDYGVNPDFFEAVWEPDAEPTVSFVGAVTRRKGIHDLVTLAGDPELQHIRFQILGDGDLMQELQQDSPDNVEWLGKCFRQKVIEVLARSWCLFIPTYADTGPTVIKEARVIGLPIITTNGAGASSYVTRHDSGHVTTPGDIHAMRRHLTELCASREHCIEVGKRGHAENRLQLSPSATAKAFAEIYKSMIN